MRRAMRKTKYLFAAALGLALTISSVPTCYGAERGRTTGSDAVQDGTAEEETNVVEINSTEDFLAMAEQCRYDSWSMERVVRLNVDLDLSGQEFEGIAYFNGIFEGNGHTISQISLEPKGSDYGLFRYVGGTGEIRELNVSGTVKPSGSQTSIGGLAGVNYGTITGCSFAGSVSGLEMVGAIAGTNKTTGKIVDCSSNAQVSATNHTGGIVGYNEGFVSGCRNESSINTEELEPTLDLAGVDLGTLNLAQNVVNRNNLGGIAGYSSGVVTGCRNDGTVGCRHSGYNAGGIVGCQSGIISESENYGSIYGRKDVGGIAGQAEPYVESEYLEDKVRQTQEEISRLNNTLNHISSTVSNTSAEVRRYADSLDRQYTDSLQDLSDHLDTITGAAAGNPDVQVYVDNINAAKGRIDEIYAGGNRPTEEQLEEVGRHLETINNNVESLRGAYGGTAQTPEEFVQNVSAELNGNGENRSTELKHLADTVDNGVQSVVSSMKQAVSQMNRITNSVSDDLAILTGDEEVILDISSIETAENTDGVIMDCINRGEISGDLNVGGIAGTMNIEYDLDPEFDLRFHESVNITLRSTVNDVMIRCINYGSVTVKRNYAGGITGMQELGFVYDCEAYGNVGSETGNYLGGIAGESAGAIEKSYAFCRVAGTDYVGGICGNGYTVKDCISAGDINSEGERTGSIAGHLEEEGTAKGNYFVSDTLHGIDDISYAGVADRITYEELMAMEGIPEGFCRVTIAFEAEDEIIDTISVAYGGSITENDFPRAPEQEGCYVEWDTREDLTDIRQNLTITAEYIPWKESIASEETTAEGKAIFLAAGEFYEETGLKLTETDGPGNPDETGVPAYAYSWELTDTRDRETSSVEGHFIIPEAEGTAQVWIRQEDGWSLAETAEDGSYLVAELPYGADFAVTVQPAEQQEYLLICIGVLAVLLVVVIVRGAVVYRRNRNEDGYDI